MCGLHHVEDKLEPLWISRGLNSRRRRRRRRAVLVWRLMTCWVYWGWSNAEPRKWVRNCCYCAQIQLALLIGVSKAWHFWWLSNDLLPQLEFSEVPMLRFLALSTSHVVVAGLIFRIGSTCRLQIGMRELCFRFSDTGVLMCMSWLVTVSVIALLFVF